MITLVLFLAFCVVLLLFVCLFVCFSDVSLSLSTMEEETDAFAGRIVYASSKGIRYLPIQLF